MMRWICALVGHRPDRAGALEKGGTLHSTCQRCGATMTRDFWRGWRPLDPEDGAEQPDAVAHSE